MWILRLHASVADVKYSGPEVGGPYGPYRQSERTSLYKEYAEQLLDSEHAYRCFCTPTQLREKAIARGAAGESSEYDGTCLHIAKTESDARARGGEQYVVRMKDPYRNLGQITPWNDIIHGKMKPRAQAAKQRAGRDAWDDAVLLKSDGRPTYHLANVVDDHRMRVTHVIRGIEWLESTWKHVALYNAFGWKMPEFAHVGLLMDLKGRKLSKRDQAFDLDVMKTKYLPETLVNGLALLGWKHGQEREVFTMEMLENMVGRLAEVESS
jgi:glutamyl-tRNA synthetase